MLRIGAYSAGLLAVGVLAAACTAVPADDGGSPTYVDSTDSIANPERGFYRHENRCNRDDFNVETLRGYRDQDKITLVMCIFYLTMQDGTTPNLTSPISAAQLVNFDNQAARVRAAGAKMIVRFAYTDECPPLIPPDYVECPDGYDAAPTVVQMHLNQLVPHLQKNSDVIAVLQSGFVGRWGEGHYTRNFGNEGNVSTNDWDNRQAIVDKLLEVVQSRTVQVRTIRMKQEMYGPAPVSSDNAYGTAHVARVGHHNDCFLRNPTDSGTYTNPDVDKPYLASDSMYVAVGGETCGVSKPGDPPDRTNCSGALPELAQFHYSYLNQDWNPVVIEKWSEQGCKPEIEQRLGYRFSLVGSLFPTSVKRGSTFLAQIFIRNTGWATPFNSRPVFLVLRNTATNSVSKVRFTTDPRRWEPGTTVRLDQNLGIPDFMPTGNYELLLSLPDAATELSSNPNYAIQMATNGVWEPTTGLNRLLWTISVQ